MKNAFLLALFACTAPTLSADLPEELLNKALSGDADAQFELGKRLDAGQGLKVEPEKAARWYEKAALQGHAEAAYYLAVLHENGIGLNKNSKLAAAWYAFSAKLGHRRAEQALARLEPKPRKTTRTTTPTPPLKLNTPPKRIYEPPATAKPRPHSTIPRGYFTVGSTKNEVLVIQGTPNSFSDTKFTYGYSHVHFDSIGSVKSWNNSTLNPLKVKLLPSRETVLKSKHFTLGSTKDDVLALQGTPSSFSAGKYTYGYSHVHFDSAGRVKTWNNSTLNPLKVKLLPSRETVLKSNHFTVGSTKDEVLAIQGTPDSFSDTRFAYGYSRVHFDSAGRVKTWDNSTLTPLKAKLIFER